MKRFIKYFFHTLLIIALLIQDTSTVCPVGVSIFRYVYRKKTHSRRRASPGNCVKLEDVQQIRRLLSVRGHFTLFFFIYFFMGLFRFSSFVSCFTSVYPAM